MDYFMLSININIDDFEADSLYIKIQGSGNITMVGKSDAAFIEINGSGNIDLLDLEGELLRLRERRPRVESWAHDRDKDWRDIDELVFAAEKDFDAGWVVDWLARIVGRDDERYRRCAEALRRGS